MHKTNLTRVPTCHPTITFSYVLADIWMNYKFKRRFISVFIFILEECQIGLVHRPSDTKSWLYTCPYAAELMQALLSYPSMSSMLLCWSSQVRATM